MQKYPTSMLSLALFCDLCETFWTSPSWEAKPGGSIDCWALSNYEVQVCEPVSKFMHVEREGDGWGEGEEERKKEGREKGGGGSGVNVCLPSSLPECCISHLTQGWVICWVMASWITASCPLTASRVPPCLDSLNYNQNFENTGCGVGSSLWTSRPNAFSMTETDE